jgi:hypothetical protein
MFATRYFNRRFFAARYWPKVGATPSGAFNPAWAVNANAVVSPLSDAE